MDSKETLIRIVLLSLLLYAAGCLMKLGQNLQRAEALESALTCELATIEKDNLARSNKLEDGWRDEEWEELAWRRLGLVRPDERVFLFPQTEEQAKPES